MSRGTLRRFRNRPAAKRTRQEDEVTPRHILASGSLPPQFPATRIGGTSYWDGGIVDNTPLGDAIEAFSADGKAERLLVVMNLFRKDRQVPKNFLEVNDRLARAELRQPPAAGQRIGARRINKLVRMIERSPRAVPDDALTRSSRSRRRPRAAVQDAGRGPRSNCRSRCGEGQARDDGQAGDFRTSRARRSRRQDAGRKSRPPE